MAGSSPAKAAGRKFSPCLGNRRRDRAQAFLVALVEGPLLDPLGAHRADLGEELHVLGHGRLADAELLGDQEAADAVLDEVAVDLLAEMRARVLEPVEDLQATFIGEGAKRGGDFHFGNWLIS